MRLNWFRMAGGAFVGANLLLVSLGQAAPLSGPYLAARQAVIVGDYAKVAEFGDAALRADPNNERLRYSVAEAFLILGDVEGAQQTIDGHSLDAVAAERLAAVIQLVGQFKADNYEEIILQFKEGQRIGPLVDELLQGWAEFGAGRLSDAISSFDSLKQERPSFAALADYNAALVYAIIGNLEGSDRRLAAGGNAVAGVGSIAMHATILSQLDRKQEALDLVRQAMQRRSNPILNTLIQQLELDEDIQFTDVTTPQEGAAQSFLALAQLLSQDQEPRDVLRFARAAELLDPELSPATLLVAGLFRQIGQESLALEAYGRVLPQSGDYLRASLARADLLSDTERSEEALEIIDLLMEKFPDTYEVILARGDELRFQERYQEAAETYSAAINLIETPERREWFVFYARGICYERLGEWPLAEEDFRTALKYNPGQPQVLNYLGYSLVEKGRNLDEALSMIQQAVQAEPRSGYIVDSLGWAYYRLGRFEEAVSALELAVELSPEDPVLNDHLGDAYWAVGRKREAEFQWRRAISFEPAEEELFKIREKLQEGMALDTAPDLEQ